MASSLQEQRGEGNDAVLYRILSDNEAVEVQRVSGRYQSFSFFLVDAPGKGK